MGRQVICEVRVGDRAFETKVDLEGEEIVVRGPEGFRLKFAELHSFGAKGGVLQLANDKREVALSLGGEAEVWAQAIRQPRGRLDKLGIKLRSRVALLGELPADLRAEVERSGAVIVRGGAVQMVLLAVAHPRELSQLDSLRAWVAPAGAIWVIRKKEGRGLQESELRAAARAAGLVAVKVAKIDEVWTADKLIVPEKLRVGVSELPLRRPLPGAGARPHNPRKERRKRPPLGAVAPARAVGGKPLSRFSPKPPKTDGVGAGRAPRLGRSAGRPPNRKPAARKLAVRPPRGTSQGRGGPGRAAGKPSSPKGRKRR